LAALNRKINQGVTITSLRNELAKLEKNIAHNEAYLENVRGDLGILPGRLQREATDYYGRGIKSADKVLLDEFGVTRENYENASACIAERLSEAEGYISNDRAKIKDTAETLTAFERIMSLTYVDNLAMMEHDKRQAKRVGNGIKAVDISLTENNRVDEVVAKVEEAVDVKQAYTPKRK
jgi:hypothetical protein